MLGIGEGWTVGWESLTEGYKGLLGGGDVDILVGAGLGHFAGAEDAMGWKDIRG